MGNAQLKDIEDDNEDFVDELKPGTKLMHGQYEIEKFLNAGGFGITYLAKDSLDRKIVIKECFPGAFCRRSKSIVQARSRAHQPELKSIVRLFVQEARSLSKLQHPNIVGVHQVFEDNDTAYMALDFVEGRDLLDTLEDPDHGLNPAQIKSILTDILGAVGFVHDQKMLHRDISPDNILIDENLRPVLIDFGAAREQATKQSRVLSALRVVKDGYSPQEFYIAGSAQDPSSDLYALGASFYHLIADEVPPNSQARLAAIASGEKDPYVPLGQKVDGYDSDFLAAIDMSLQVLPKDRVQSAQDWLDMMAGVKPIVSKPATVIPAASAGGGEKKKSRIPLLMASVGVVALLGLVVVTQTDILNPATEASLAPTTAEAVEAPAVEGIGAQAVETPSVAPQAPAVAPIVEAVAPIAVEEPVTEPVVAAEDTPAAPVAEEPVIAAEETPAAPVAEEPIVVAEPVVEEALPIVDVPAIDLETAVVAVPDALVLDPVAPDAAAPTTEVSFDRVIAPMVLEQATPPVTIPEVEVIAGPLEQVAEPATGLIDVSIYPALRPAYLGLEPLPTPVIIRDVALRPNLPGFLTGVADVPSSATPAIALPETPADVAAEALTIAFEAPALVPGKEIIEEPAPVVVEEVAAPAIVETDDSVAGVADREATGTIATVADSFFILSGWSVGLPFTASETNPDTIGAAAIVAPAWVKEGVVVKGVNGTPVASIDDIQAVLRETVRPGDAADISVNFEVETDGVVSNHDWPMPIRQDFQLLNGVAFSASNVDDAWVTKVSAIPDGVQTDLAVGDTLIAYMANSTKFETRTALKELLDSEVAAGTTQFSFAVNRDNSMWVAGLEYNPNPETD